MGETVFNVKIHQERCKGCEYCILSCQRGCLQLSSDLNAEGYHFPTPVKMDECAGCLDCAIMCPEMAIEIYELAD